MLSVRQCRRRIILRVSLRGRPQAPDGTSDLIQLYNSIDACVREHGSCTMRHLQRQAVLDPRQVAAASW